MDIRRIACAAACAACAVAAPASAEIVSMVCYLSSSQEVPANASTADGCGRFTIDTDANTVQYRIAFAGLSAAQTAAHIHGPADPGVNAGVKHALALGSPLAGVWNYPEADEGDILAGKMYVNVHTGANPGGEIRGQIVDMVAVLDGSQESPPVSLPGRGVGLLMIDPCLNVLSYHVIFGGLGTPQTAAHIHGFALHGTNVGVQHPLPLGSPAIGAWTYPEAAEEGILEGRTYINVHTQGNPGGEIRGQITRHLMPIDAGQEVPPNGSPGAGVASIALSTATDQLSYHVRHQGLTAPASAAHIHGFAPPGVNAGVLHSIGPATPVVGVWSYPAASETSILDGLTYINVHTPPNPGGEIRGQLVFAPAPAPCPADVNCDGMVDFSDLLQLLSAWGGCAGCREDIDGDGDVGFGDLLLLLAAWGPC